ncbi:MAG: 3-deoxy-D-manno-octulosonic acid transferase [Fibrobacterota bacterium]
MLLQVLYVVVSPVLWCILSLGFLVTPKGRKRRFAEPRIFLRALIKYAGIKKKNKTVLIIHASSAGEYEQVKPLLEILDRESFCIIQTFYSPTIYSREKDSALCDVCLYHPLDSIISAMIFFLCFRPRYYIVNRHDLWPAHIWAASALRIKCIYMNANIYEKSLRYTRPGRFFYRPLLARFSIIFTGSHRLLSLFRDVCPAAHVQIAGDTRFEQVVRRAESNPRNHFTQTPPAPLIVLGSIIPSDYSVVLPAIAQYIRSGRNRLFTLAVPHETDSGSISALEKYLDGEGLSHERYSRKKAFGASEVLIVDRVGILPELYGYAMSAYVGAGFGAGVHSVIEPAVYGIPVAFGPSYGLLDEAVCMVEKNIAHCVTSRDDMYDFLSGPIDSKQEAGRAGKELVYSRLGAKEKIADFLSENRTV